MSLYCSHTFDSSPKCQRTTVHPSGLRTAHVGWSQHPGPHLSLGVVPSFLRLSYPPLRATTRVSNPGADTPFQECVPSRPASCNSLPHGNTLPLLEICSNTISSRPTSVRLPSFPRWRQFCFICSLLDVLSGPLVEHSSPKAFRPKKLMYTSRLPHSL